MATDTARDVARLSFDLLSRPLPWSTNQDRRMHFSERPKKEWRDVAQRTMSQYRARRSMPRPIVVEGQLAIIHITIPFDENKVRDPHNYCGTVVKAVIDGLVRGGLAPDDNSTWVQHIEPTLVVAPKTLPRVDVRIVERG